MSWFDWLLSMDARRKKLLAKAPAGAMRDFLSQPFPDAKLPINQTPILSVDFETTGLNSLTEQILSIGFVAIDNMQVKLATAEHHLVQTEGALTAENVLIHQITDQHKATGNSLEAAVEQLLNAMTGRVMLVHYARIETSFLAKACQQLYGITPVFPIIDTLLLAKRQLDKSSVPYDPSQLRLMAQRNKFELPFYQAHNALSDAIATAELLFAQVHRYHQGGNTPIKAILR